MNKGIVLTIAALLLLLNSCGNKKSESASTEEAVEKALQTESKPERTKEVISDKVRTISTEEFIDLVTEIDNPKGFQYKGSLPCIVEFYAGWCAPCHALSPILDELASEYKGQILIYKIDVDRANTLNTIFNISNVPTLLFFKKDTPPSSIIGAPKKPELKKAIDDILI